MNFKRLISFILALLIIPCFLFSCKKDNKSNEADTITITDHLGYEIQVPKEINRIVVGKIYPMPSVISIFFDSGEKLVGIPKESMSAFKNSLLAEMYPEVLDAETEYINGAELNIEAVLALKPDVFIYNAADKEHGEILKKAGIPAVAVSVNKWDYDAVQTLEEWIKLLSLMFPENDKSKIVTDYSNKIIEMIRTRTNSLSEDEIKSILFLYQYSDTMIATSGNKFFGQWWADTIGARNAGESLKKDNSVSISMEHIYSWDPDCILITNFTSATPESLYSNSVGNDDWSNIKAVKNKEVYKMPLGTYRTYTCGADTPITLLWMSKTVYPELFSDINLIEETKKYYLEVFGISLNDNQAKEIFQPKKGSSAF